MDLLLDTHVFLWWDANSEKLGAGARDAIADPENRVFVSAASVWEIAIKSRKGKLDFSGSPSHAVTANGFLPLVIEPRHAEVAAALAWSHPDPFDRMLVAQARMMNLALVHADAAIASFGGVVQLPAR